MKFIKFRPAVEEYDPAIAVEAVTKPLALLSSTSRRVLKKVSTGCFGGHRTFRDKPVTENTYMKWGRPSIYDCPSIAKDRILLYKFAAKGDSLCASRVNLDDMFGPDVSVGDLLVPVYEFCTFGFVCGEGKSWGLVHLLDGTEGGVGPADKDTTPCIGQGLVKLAAPLIAETKRKAA